MEDPVCRLERRSVHSFSFLFSSPGSSSFLGWLFEGVGPFSVTGAAKLAVNPFAWNRKADLIMFDQPAGVGLSYSSSASCYPTNTRQSSMQLASAIEALWRMPALGLAGKRLFVVGESYGGTWVPLLMSELAKSSVVKLGGQALGDGWVDPRAQQGTYSYYAIAHGLVSLGAQAQALLQLELACIKSIDSFPVNATIPSWVNDVCNKIEEYIVNVSNTNVLDVRNTDDYDFSPIAAYLNRQEVFSALHLVQDPKTNGWAPDSDAIGTLFATGEQNSVAPVVSMLLQSVGLPTLIYNGVFDMDCNFFGTDLWLQQSSWGQAVGLDQISRVPWFLNGEQVGMRRHAGLLEQVVLMDAGHLVPYNVPHVARAMIEQFVANLTLFNDFSEK